MTTSTPKTYWKKNSPHQNLVAKIDATIKSIPQEEKGKVVTSTQKIIDDAIEYSHTTEFSAVTDNLCLAIAVMSEDAFNQAIGFFTGKIESHFDSNQQKEFDLSISRNLYAWLDAYKTEKSKRELREYRDKFIAEYDDAGIATQLINTLI